MLELKILLDTSFILPSLGLSVEKEVIETIKYFRVFEIYYSELSLLEALWKIVRLIRPEDMEIVLNGIRSIKRTYYRVEIPVKAYGLAYKMYRNGHRDIIDNLLYSAAYILNMRFLTLDEELISFLKSKGYPTESVVISPKELRSIAGKM